MAICIKVSVRILKLFSFLKKVHKSYGITSKCLKLLKEVSNLNVQKFDLSIAVM